VTDKIVETKQESVSGDGVDRRGFLKCMAWAGTGLVWSFVGGIPVSRAFGSSKHGERPADFNFVQISDSHIGFNKPVNTDVTATLQAALDKISADQIAPDFLIHTGDLTHSSKPAEFDTLDQVLVGTRRQVFYVPGEHDTSVDDGKMYLDRYGKGTKGNGWYSFDHKGVHFIGLVNVVQLEGMGKLGQPQLDWLKQDLAGLKYPHRGLRPYSALGDLSDLGMGHIGQRASPGHVEALWFGLRTQWPHSPGHAKSGGEPHVPHCDVHRVPAACPRDRALARPDEGSCRQAPQRPGDHSRQFRCPKARSCCD